MITYLSAPINQQGIVNRVARSLLPDVSALSLFSICDVRHLNCVYVQIFKVPQQSRGTVLRRELASEIGLGTLSEVFVLLEQQCFCGLLVEAVLSTNVLVVAVSCSPRRTFTRPGYISHVRHRAAFLCSSCRAADSAGPCVVAVS